MSSFFTTHPLGTFLTGLVLGGGAMGGAALFYRSRLNQTAAFLGVLLDRPDLYRRIRDGEWMRLHRAAVGREIDEATAAHAAAVSTEE